MAANTLWRMLPSSRMRALATVAAVNLFIFAITAVSLYSSRQQYDERAALAARNTNRLVSQGIAGDIDRIDLALRAIVDEYARQTHSGTIQWPALSDFLSRLRDRLPMVSALRITDANGLLVAGSDGIPPTISLGDRPYFVRLKTSPGNALVISEPIISRVTGRATLIFVRRLDDAQGRFAGMAVAPVPVDWFNDRFNRLEVGPNGVVVMRGDASRDFDLLARHPAGGFVGQTKVSDTFRATITAQPRDGSYQARAGADNVLRTFSYAAVGDYPLITLVGLAPEDYLAGWWREVWKLTAMAASFSLATVLGGLAMYRTGRMLEQRTEELARSNADLEQFAYVASHDLQTPLRNIVSFTQLLERRYRGQMGDEADEFITYIVNGAKRMSELVADLLDYARISTSPRATEPVSLDNVLKAVLADLQVEITALEATVEALGPLPLVDAEPLPMERLFRNLLENAIRYRQPDRLLRIVVEAEREADGFWRVAVRDNGIGMDPQYHDRAFTMFQRLNPRRYPDGTGIGLAICRRIVYRFGGRIWIESTPGEGTGVLFTLPPGSVEHEGHAVRPQPAAT